MNDQVARGQVFEQPQVQRPVLSKALTQPVAVVALKNLVVGVEGRLHLRVDETGVDGGVDGLKTDAGFQVLEDGIEAFDLLWVTGKEVIRQPAGGIFQQVADQQIHVLIKTRLRLGPAVNGPVNFKLLFVVGEEHYWFVGYVTQYFAGADEGAFVEQGFELLVINHRQVLGKFVGFIEGLVEFIHQQLKVPHPDGSVLR